MLADLSSSGSWRYAKYVAIGSLLAAVGATAFGSVISGVAWIVAPTSFGAGIVAATVWYFGKWGDHQLQRKWGRLTNEAWAIMASKTFQRQWIALCDAMALGGSRRVWGGAMVATMGTG